MNGLPKTIPHPDGRGWLMEVNGRWYEIHEYTPGRSTVVDLEGERYAVTRIGPDSTPPKPAPPAKARHGLTMIRGGLS